MTGTVDCPWCNAPIVPRDERLAPCGGCGRRVEVVSSGVIGDGPQRQMTVLEAFPAPPPLEGALVEERGDVVFVESTPIAISKKWKRRGNVLMVLGVITMFLPGASLVGRFIQFAVTLAWLRHDAVLAFGRRLSRARVRFERDHVVFGKRRVTLADISTVTSRQSSIFLTLRDGTSFTFGRDLAPLGAGWLAGRIERARKTSSLRGRDATRRLAAPEEEP